MEKAPEKNAEKNIDKKTGTKSEIRSKILKMRNALTEEERKRAAFLLTERILGHQWY